MDQISVYCTNVTESIFRILRGILAFLPFPPSEANTATQDFHGPHYLLIIHGPPFGGVQIRMMPVLMRDVGVTCAAGHRDCD